VSLAGAIVVGISESGGGRSSVLGVALCVVAAVCYAAGVVFQKPTPLRLLPWFTRGR
jgi:drug/metabolite transporter (DMT)-like permease